MQKSAVLFDLGGVVLGSPLHAIRDYEAELGLDRNAINLVAANTAPAGAWSRLERGELEMEAFYPAFEADCRGAGIEMDAREMMARMALSTGPRPVMIAALGKLRREGYRLGALTNNWAHTGDEERPEQNDGTRDLKAHFHIFIESSVEGLRKPDPRIYELACTRLEKRADEIVFLDDIGPNLKPARAMGMSTIKVETPEEALTELSAILGLDLVSG